MNPWCPNCTEPSSILITKTMSTGYEEKQFFKRLGKLVIRSIRMMGGRAKYWYCRKCKRRWLKGSGGIMKK